MLAPSSSWYMPGSQGVHTPAPEREKLPGVQAVSSCAPNGQKLPATQPTHSDAPAAEACLPASQSAHAPLGSPANAKLPAAHCSGAVAAVGQAKPAGHVLQPACDERSVAALQLPASHGRATLAPSAQ